MKSDAGIRLTSNRRDFLLGLGTVTVAGLASPAVLRAQRAPIRIGAVLHLSGPLAVYGQEQKVGLEMYVKETNAAGGIAGRSIELILEDDGTRPQLSVEKARKLVTLNNVDVLTGSMLTTSVIAIAQYAKEVRTPYLSIGGTTAATIKPPNCGKFHAHFSSIPATVGMATLPIANKFGKNARWYFVGNDYEFGHDGINTMRDIARNAASIQDVGQAFPPLGTTDFTPIVSLIAGAKPDVVAISLTGVSYGQFMKQLRLFGIKSHVHSIFLSTIDAASAGDASVGMTGGTFFLFDNPQVPRATEFTENYYKASGSWPAGFAATAVTAMEMYKIAVEKIGDTDKEKVADTIAGLAHEKSLLGAAHVRRCDGQLVSTTYIAEIARDPKYGFTYKRLGELSVADIEKNLTPCGQTGCEAG